MYELFCEAQQLLIGLLPVQPGYFVVLTVGIVVPALRAPPLVTGQKHWHALREKKRYEHVAFLLLAQGYNARRRKIAGSFIGGIAETQQMLDYCAGHGIVSEGEVIPPAYINTAFERTLKGDVRYRFVIDMSML